jgi:hypothetical protein
MQFVSIWKVEAPLTFRASQLKDAKNVCLRKHHWSRHRGYRKYPLLLPGIELRSVVRHYADWSIPSLLFL